MSLVTDLNSLQGLTLDEIAQKVGQALEAQRKGPTHPADIALKNNFMDITRNVNVPYVHQEFPKAVYRLKPATRSTPAKVECIGVKNAEEQARQIEKGWQLEQIVLEPVEEEAPPLPAATVARLLGSTEPIALPIGRRAGRPKKFSAND
jgi:hypothetical protein